MSPSIPNTTVVAAIRSTFLRICISSSISFNSTTRCRRRFALGSIARTSPLRATPVLHMTGTRDWDLLARTLPRKRRTPFNSIRRDDQYLLVVGGASHTTFSDEESEATRPAHDVIRMTSIVFLDAYLRGDRDALATLRDGDLSRALDGLGHLTVKSAPVLRIGKIAIHTAPVFDPEEASHGGLYRAVDMIAVRTPEELIRRFLLFREGEPFDAGKLTESERNLRTFDFLKTVSVTAGQQHDGIVDVDVTTQDAFSTDVDLEFSNDGGRSLYTFAVTQLDLFGRGSSLGLHTEQGRERRLNSIEFIDPATFGRYWNANVLLAKNSDGNEERLAIGRPLFASSTHFTLDGLTDHLLQVARIYQDAAIHSQFRHEHRELELNGGVKIDTQGVGNLRLLAGMDFLTDTFAPVFGLQPDDRRFRFVTLGLDSTQFDLIKLDHVDYGLKDQDFNLGVVKFSTRYPMTLVSRLRADLGSHLDRDVQFFADGQNGLRAYPNFAFEGRRRVLLNIEQRMFLGRELWQVVEPGAAIFLDSARVGGLRSDFGAGLRFSIARYQSAIIRVDAAYAVNDSPISKRGLVISVATTQAF